jgi:hypothetical protein
VSQWNTRLSTYISVLIGSVFFYCNMHVFTKEKYTYIPLTLDAILLFCPGHHTRQVHKYLFMRYLESIPPALQVLTFH